MNKGGATKKYGATEKGATEKVEQRKGVNQLEKVEQKRKGGATKEG